MTFTTFFERLQDQFANNLPFAAYRNPGATAIKSFLQNDNTLYKTTDFTESGFVFAPFNLEDPSVLIPVDASEIMECDSLDFKVKKSTNSTSEATQIIKESSAKQDHIELVEKGVEAILDDAFEKVVLSRKEAVTISEAQQIEVFKKLLSAYPTAYVYIWFHPQIGLWLGATPETLLHVENKQVKTMALAGTQVYKDTTDVIWQEKELHEQQIVTDFIVSGLKNHLESITVSDVETTKAGSLLHLKTHISGRINSEESGLKNIIKTLHPTPAVCGMPKEIAKSFIIENELYKRTYYSGFLGELNLKKSVSRNSNRRNVENNAYASIKTVSNLFVNLRCMEIQNNEAFIYIGGGITDGSNPTKEWEETVAKSQTMKKVLQ
ncbi:isochorismate synthase [Bizionia argentinensis JUB59]|uniref:Isochorismate synthase n=1 Tax=Bizionia argentinensis JUB59 TaxID=1046627 RepID=G2E9W4_9FLAO|nr:chorismate-binding protein [Bizionia argentinensis]EGV44911.1 isochorismate synthase [Bizionia argentinensis JUB59]